MTRMGVPYPAHREADVALRDGSTVRVRPVRPDDLEGVRTFLAGLSKESLALRFFSASIDLEREARRGVEVDYENEFGLVATIEGRIVGHGVWFRTGPDHAEVAQTIADAYQGMGLGTIMLGHLAEAAAERGITVFTAQTLPENHRMVGVFRESGLPVTMRTQPGVIEIEIGTSISPEALERFERREQLAAAAAVRSFLRPHAVAVIGAGRERGTVGAEIFHNLLAYGFNGPVYPVNPKAEVVQSVRSYPSILDVPEAIDLAIVAVPAEEVVDVALECAERDVPSLVVVSAGFAELGEAGAARQRELLRVCRETGMRLVGPNCMGVLNTATDVRLNATFAPVAPPRGRVAFLSQSGALGLAVVDFARVHGLGLSSFVSVGNKADLSGNDFINYWESDEDTDVILLYLESFGNPRKFARITRRVGKRKPIVAVKSGRSGAGARASSSHTGALVAASDVTVEALFHQAGVIRTDTLQELFDVAALVADQPPPAGPRVGIVTNGGGLGVVCTDACESDGLVVPPLGEAVRAKLAGFLPPEASVANPVDMVASATAEDYGRALSLVAAEGSVDAVVVIFIRPLATRAQDVAAAVAEAVRRLPRPIPVLTVFMSSEGEEAVRALRAPDVRIPVYSFPEEAARALSRAVRYGQWRARPEGSVVEFPEVDRDEAAALLAKALRQGPRWLTPDESAELLSCWGFPLVEQRTVRTPKEAERAAAAIGPPVALKVLAPTLIHKADAGGVRIGLVPEEVAETARRMKGDVTGVGHRVEGYVVQRAVPPGVEMLVGVVHDRLFGPVVACGAGGAAVELVKDVAVRITPLTDRDAGEMVRSLATFPLLDGFRGAPKADVAALEEILLRVGAMVESHPSVAEMDLNPVIVHPHGAVIVDARVRVEPEPARPPIAARRT